MMQDTGESVSSAYVGLRARPNDAFPRTCVRCQCQFSDLDDFVANTSPIFRASGLMERDDPADGTVILLLRNCTCGTTLALRCEDRRDGTEKGTFRRRRFETMVALLLEAGVEPGMARAELRRMLHV